MDTLSRRGRASIEIAALADSDRAVWERLARGYNRFHDNALGDEEYERAWQRLSAGRRIRGLGARRDGRLVGIAHFLFHTNIWRPRVCYLQDLFVDEAARGSGVARALIDAVAAVARTTGASRFYWQTTHDNAAARALFDKVARFRGFIRYDYPIE